jgi:hypothetical protein
MFMSLSLEEEQERGGGASFCTFKTRAVNEVVAD